MKVALGWLSSVPVGRRLLELLLEGRHLEQLALGAERGLGPLGTLVVSCTILSTTAHAWEDSYHHEYNYTANLVSGILLCTHMGEGGRERETRGNISQC